MANLFYVDEDGTIKTVANTNSPSFIGNPTTVSRETHTGRGIINVADAIQYIDSIINEFNLTRLVYDNSGTLSGLAPGKKYMVSVYGRFSPGNNSTYNLGSIAIKDSSNRVLKTTGNTVKNLTNPMCPVTQNAILIVNKVPSDGKVFGFVNFDDDTSTGIEASYMTAVRLS